MISNLCEVNANYGEVLQMLSRKKFCIMRSCQHSLLFQKFFSTLWDSDSH